MLGWIIEIRNFFLAAILAWVGVTLIDDQVPATPDPADTAIASIDVAISDIGISFLLQ